MSMRNFLTRLDKVTSALQPPVQVIAFPTVYQMDDGSDYPGYEAQNVEAVRLAKRQGLTPEVYSASKEPWWNEDGIDL